MTRLQMRRSGLDPVPKRVRLNCERKKGRTKIRGVVHAEEGPEEFYLETDATRADIKDIITAITEFRRRSVVEEDRVLDL